MEPFIQTGAISYITWVGEMGQGQPHPSMAHAESPKEDGFQEQRAVVTT